MVEGQEHEGRSAQIMFWALRQDKRAVGYEPKIRMGQDVLATVVHTNSNRLNVGLSNQFFQFGLFHVEKLRARSGSVKLRQIAIQTRKSASAGSWS